MAMNAFLPLLTTKTDIALSSHVTIDTFNEFKENDFNPVKELAHEQKKCLDNHLREYKDYKTLMNKYVEGMNNLTQKALKNTEEAKTYASSTEALINERERFVENFITQVNNNVSVMQAYVERQLLEARIEQEITQRQLNELLTLPWYKRFTKRQRVKILERVRNTVLEEYTELKEIAEKKINKALLKGNIIIKNTNNEGQSNANV